MPLRDMDREQIWLLPPSLDELLPLDHPGWFVAEFVDGLDREGWAELGVEIEGDPRGAPAYHPRALLCVWLYGFMTGLRSCRKLEAACRDQIPYLWLTGWQHPDHNTLWRFYKAHRQAMRELFKRTVRTAVAMELVDLAVQAVDGSKVAANATRDRTYDAERGGRLLNRLEKAIADLEAQNEAGEDTPAVHLPEELADKRALREQVRQAMDDLASQESLKHINLTDKDARLMKTRQGIVPSEVRLQTDRIQVQAVIGIVEEQRQLPVNVHRPQVLECGTEQHYLVVAGLQVVAQAPGALVDVAEVVSLVYQHRPTVGEPAQQVDAAVGRCRIHVPSSLFVELRVRRAAIMLWDSTSAPRAKRSLNTSHMGLRPAGQRIRSARPTRMRTLSRRGVEEVRGGHCG